METRISYKSHAEDLARSLWRAGCCTPGLGDRLLGTPDPKDAEHSEACALAAFIKRSSQ